MVKHAVLDCDRRMCAQTRLGLLVLEACQSLHNRLWGHHRSRCPAKPLCGTKATAFGVDRGCIRLLYSQVLCTKFADWLVGSPVCDERRGIGDLACVSMSVCS